MCGKSDEKYFNIIGWILQIGTWLFLILFIVLHKTGFLIIFILAYLLYLLMEFCSPTSRYLCNKSSHHGMYEKMKEYFHTPPEIRWHIECYHYEHHEHTKVSAGTGVGVEHYTSKEKVVTHLEDLSMSYYSARDISGLFQLNCDKALLKRKCYIKLELIAKIDFADPPTVRDYHYQKFNFYNMYRYSDSYCNLTEERVIPGMDQYNLVKLTHDEPKSINFGLFFLFTMLTFVEFYKIYIDSLCIYQKFDVKKIISTRYDLNLDQYIQMYQAFIPRIDLLTVQYNYQPADYTYLNKGYDLNLPSQEEVENQLKNTNFDFENGYSSQNINPNTNNQNGYSSQNLNPNMNQNGYSSQNLNPNMNQNWFQNPNMTQNGFQNPNMNPNMNQNGFQNPNMNQNGFQNQNINQNGYPNQNMNPNINQNGFQNQNINQNGFPNQNINPNINVKMEQNTNLNPNQNNYQLPTQNSLNNNNVGIEVNINNQQNSILKKNNFPPKFISDDNIQSSERLNPKSINENNETRVNIENNNDESFSPINSNKQEKKQ